jgi:hypothetical protein
LSFHGKEARRSLQLAVAALVLGTCAAFAEQVPLPRLRPSIAPGAPIPLAGQAIPLPRPRPAMPLPHEVTSEPRPPSDCQLSLTSDIAVIEPLPSISGVDGCGIEDAVKLSAIFTKDKVRVTISPPATLRCEMAQAVTNWVREDAAQIAASLGAPLSGVQNFAAYECRGRNRIVGAKISEHGKGNALDIRALMLSNGKRYEPTDMAVSKEVRERLKASVCARFTTVLGPASDGYHENHIHIDIAARRGGYRICQWAVHDATATIPLPRERPSDAPQATP